MMESQVIRAWQREARMDQEIKTMHRAILQILRARFGPEPSPDIRLDVEGTNDLKTLSRWLDLALTAASQEEFRDGMTSP